MNARRRSHLLALLILGLLVFLFLWRVLVGGRLLLPTDDLFAFPPWKSYAAAQGVTVPHNELIADMILQNYSWKSFARESYRQGEFPLWNPYVFSGVPFLAAGQYAALYPLGVIFYLLPVAQAYGWFTALHLFLGGAFTYLYLRVIRASWLGSLLGGVAFAFSSFLVVSFLWPMILSTAIWLPLLLACIEKVIQGFEAGKNRDVRWWQKALGWGLLGSLAVGLQFLAGHLEISFYLLFSMLCYTLVRLGVFLWQHRRLGWFLGAAGGLGLMVGLGFGLAAAQLMPFYEVIRENYRTGLVTYQEVVGYALPKRHILAFLMPDVFGNPTHHVYFDVVEGAWKPVTKATDFAGHQRSYPFWGIKNYVEGAAYVGILPLALAVVALLLRRNRYTWLFFSYGAFSLLLAFGTPLYRLFFYGIPGFDQLHTPFRWIFPWSFSTIVLAGLGATALEERLRGVQTRGNASGEGIARMGVYLIAALGGGLLLALGGSRALLGPTLDLAEQVWRRSQTLPAAFESGRMFYSYEFRNVLLLGLFLLGSGLVVLWALRRTAKRSPQDLRLFATALVGLLTLDLFIVGYDFNTASDPRLLAFEPPSIAFLQQEPGPFRLTSFNLDDTLKPVSGMRYGLQDIRGYDTIILKRYVNFWRLLEDPHGLMYSMINKLVTPQALQSPLLDLMNVKYVLTTQEIGLPNFTKVYGEEINIYRNDDVLPRAFAVFQAQAVANERAALAALADPSFSPRRTVILENEVAPLSLPTTVFIPEPVIQSHRPNQVVVQVEMPQEGYLVLSDTYFPGWRAYVDGREATILRANSIHRAVRLSAGAHIVVFKYFPDSFKLGLLLTFLSLVTWALLGGAGLWGRWYPDTEGTSTVQRILKNSLTPMACQVVNKLVDFAFVVFMLRLLGPANAGKYAFAVVLIGYFLLFTDFGLGTLLTREVAKDRSQAGRYLANTIVLRLILCLLSLPVLAAVVGLYAWRFDLARDAVLTVLLFGVSLFPSAVAASFSALFNAYERMEYPAAVSLVTTLVRASAGVAVLLAGWGIVGLGAVSVLASVVTAFLFYGLVRRTLVRPSLAWDAPFQRQMAATSVPLMVNNFLATIFFRIDVMILQPLKGDAVTGWYTTAYKFVDGLNLIPSFFTLAIFPVISRYAVSSRESLMRGFNLSLRALLMVSIPIAVGTTFIADKVILLFFGEAYVPSIRALQILIWFLPFSFINSVTQYVLIAVDQQRFLTRAFIIGAGFNIVANLLVIPSFGFEGAAVVTILSELVLMAPFFYGVYRYVGRISLLALALKPTAASVLMGLVLWLLRGQNLFVMMLVGVVAYGGGMLLLRAFGEEDRAVLRTLIRR